ncbi:hypothetical protein [Romboutsia sp.]|uniref:hypothetical protein n=1 Tax=Romboutsia sp. TaxID=1965302 RepID=UPI003F3E2554
MNILPIPWMKQKLESIYSTNFYGSLYLIYNNLDYKNYYNTDSSILFNLLDDFNIIVDETHPLYLYFPLEIDSFVENLITSFKDLYQKNCKVILGGYNESCVNFINTEYILNLDLISPMLKNTINHAYMIDNSKSFEIFTSLSDTQRIYINPESSCTISGPMLNYHIKEINPNNVTHISFVRLLDESLTDNFTDYYLKGLTNSNNNFNYNF